MKINKFALALLTSVTFSDKASASAYFPFVDVGTGRCSGQYSTTYLAYPTVTLFGSSGDFSRSNPQSCIDWCKTGSGSRLVAVNIIEWPSTMYRCICNLDGTNPPSTTAYSPAATESQSVVYEPSPIAIAFSAGGNEFTNYATCWRNEVSVILYYSGFYLDSQMILTRKACLL